MTDETLLEDPEHIIESVLALPDEIIFPDTRIVQQRTAAVLATGWLLHWLSTGFSGLPILLYLKNHLHMNPVYISSYTAITLFAWNLKPIAGWISDNIAIRGRRRKPYLLISATFGSFVWLVLALVPITYQSLLWSLFAINCSLMLASTALGGLLVDSGKRNDTLGSLTAQRYAISNTVTLIAGPVGGYLAGKAFGLTIGISAACLLTLIPVFLFLLDEEPNQERMREAWPEFRRQFGVLFRSRPLWWGLAMSWLLYFAPGFGTPLLFYQQSALKFSDQFIGNLGMISGGMGLLAAFIYFKLCSKFSLSWLLSGGIVVNVIGTMCYLGYRSHGAAIVVEGIGGFVSTLALLPLWNLSARATPVGLEALGYSLMMAVNNIASRFSDLSGSWLYSHHWKFQHLVWLNAGTTALILFVIPIIPRSLIGHHDGAGSADLGLETE